MRLQGEAEPGLGAPEPSMTPASCSVFWHCQAWSFRAKVRVQGNFILMPADCAQYLSVSHTNLAGGFME